MRLLVFVRAAISSTRAPLYPLAANSWVAISMMLFRTPSGSWTLRAGRAFAVGCAVLPPMGFHSLLRLRPCSFASDACPCAPLTDPRSGSVEHCGRIRGSLLNKRTSSYILVISRRKNSRAGDLAVIASSAPDRHSLAIFIPGRTARLAHGQCRDPATSAPRHVLARHRCGTLGPARADRRRDSGLAHAGAAPGGSRGSGTELRL